MERPQTFQRLKAPCVEVLQVVASLSGRPSARKDLAESLTKLLSVLQGVAASPGALDAKLAEYTFVPISQVLRASRVVPVRALELCLECIALLLRTGWGGGLAPELAGQLLILFTFMTKPSSAENGITATSEELRMTALKCTSELLTQISRTPQGRQFLTSTANIPALGESVLVTLDRLTGDSSNAVRLQALTAIKATVSAIDDRDALASFLPRMISSLTKVLMPSSSNRAGFRVLQHGLETVSLLLLRVLSDGETKDLPSQGSLDESQSKVSRTIPWLRATASQIKIALSNIFKLRNHDKTEVRQALLQLCLRVIQDCRQSLSECVSISMETTVALAGRSGPQDQTETDLKVLVYSDPKLSELLKESLHGWIISLPRVMQSKDDAIRRQNIQQISVALRLLEEENAMIDDVLADNLLDSVSSVISDSKGLEQLVESSTATTERTELALNETKSTLFQPLKLQLKGQNDIMNEFGMLLHEISKSGAALVVARDLIDSMNASANERQLASFWISVNLLRDAMTYNPSIDDFLDIGTSNVQAELLDDLYSRSLARLAQTDTEVQSHWHFQALALEAIALQATRYGSDFRAELGETLYPVLHRLGSPNPHLRSHAISCLNILADACGYASTSDLVISNVDYIVNDIGLKLNVGDVSPQAPQVLLMMMRLCGPSLLPYLDDLVASMFGALERFHGYPRLVELLFTVLRGMAEEGVHAPQLAIAAREDIKPNKGLPKSSNIRDVVDLVKKLQAESVHQRRGDLHKTEGSFHRQPWKEVREGTEELTVPTEAEAEAETISEQAEPLPPTPRTYSILLKISELTQHYLTSSSPNLRTSLLSLLHTTIPALSKHENSFLPLINTLWPVLLPRLEDPEAYVVSNALDVVALMCTHAGNFMKSRIENSWELFKALHRRIARKTDNRQEKKKLLPTGSSLAQLNIGLTKLNIMADVDFFRPESYVDAPTRMIWESFVALLCSVAAHVVVREEYFYDILDMLGPILERSNVRTALDRRNADAVWLSLYKKSKRQEEKEGGEPSRSAISFFHRSTVSAETPHWKFVRL